MVRFLFWTAVFLIGGGLYLHYQVHIAFFDSWVGHLPGDLRLKGPNVTIYFPLASAVLSGAVVSVVTSLLFKSSSKEKK